MSPCPTCKVATPATAGARAKAFVSAPLGAGYADAPLSVVDASLVVKVLAFSLGLALVAASLMPVDQPAYRSLPMGHPDMPHRLVARPARFAGVVLTKPSASSTNVAAARRSEFRSSDRGTGPLASPLFPQNGLLVWDSIRLSSKHDMRAFLLFTASQIHSPAIAATPGPLVTLPCCPR